MSRNRCLHPIRNLMICACSGAIVFAAMGAAPQEEVEPKVDNSVLKPLVASAEEAMAQSDWASAKSYWQRALSASPTSPEIAYNLGVAAYRNGDFLESASAFETAAEMADADLAAHAMYNEGTARYAEALERLNSSQDVPANTMPPSQVEADASDPLNDAIERVGNALTHFKDAAAANPSNNDARANAELATRLLKQLQELEQQQQQQQQDQQ